MTDFRITTDDACRKVMQLVMNCALSPSEARDAYALEMRELNGNVVHYGTVEADVVEKRNMCLFRDRNNNVYALDDAVYHAVRRLKSMLDKIHAMPPIRGCGLYTLCCDAADDRDAIGCILKQYTNITVYALFNHSILIHIDATRYEAIMNGEFSKLLHVYEYQDLPNMLHVRMMDTNDVYILYANGTPFAIKAPEFLTHGQRQMLKEIITNGTESIYGASAQRGLYQLCD